MLKLTARYTDEDELRRFIDNNREKYTVRCKPVISKPVQKRPESGYYKREIWLDKPTTKRSKPKC